MGDFGIFLEKFDGSFMRSGNNRVVTEVLFTKKLHNNIQLQC